MRLEGKVAVVTGGGSGIGRETCALFAAEGAQVVVVDRHEDDAAAVAQAIAGGGVSPLAVRCDVADESDIRSLARRCEAHHGRVDVLVNNAGVRVYGPVTEADQDSWDLIYSVNLRGAALVAKHTIPLMVRHGGGTIVNVSSVHAVVGRPQMAQYDAMKAGLLALTRSMACDHAEQGIRVNAVLPGATLTEYHLRRAQEAGAELDESVTQAHPGGPGLLRRQAKPREIAFANLFMACDESSYVNGTYLLVDGGLSATSQRD